jgi:hypothetical protein
MFCLPQDCKRILLEPPTTTNAAIDSDVISTKTFKKIWVCFDFKQAVSHQTVCSIYQDTSVSGSGAAITEVMPNWYNNDISTADTLTKGTDAATVTLAAGTTDQSVILEIDPVILTATYDCIHAHTTASSQATNFVNITAYGLTRYPQGTPPTGITN